MTGTLSGTDIERLYYAIKANMMNNKYNQYAVELTCVFATIISEERSTKCQLSYQSLTYGITPKF